MQNRYKYSLVDFYVVAYLLCKSVWDKKTNTEYSVNGSIKDVKSHPTKKGTRIFVVETDMEADDLIRHYYNEDILVSPKELSNNIRDMKSIIHQKRKKMRGGK